MDSIYDIRKTISQRILDWGARKKSKKIGQSPFAVDLVEKAREINARENARSGSETVLTDPAEVIKKRLTARPSGRKKTNVTQGGLTGQPTLGKFLWQL